MEETLGYDGADFLLTLLSQGEIIEDEVGRLIGGQGKPRCDVAVLYANGDAGSKAKFELLLPFGLEANFVRTCLDDLMRVLSIVTSRAAAKLVSDIASYGRDPSYQPPLFIGLTCSVHEVCYLTHTFCGEEAGEQHIGIGKIELFCLHLLEYRLNAEIPSFVVIEQGGEYAGGVEIGEAHKVNRAI